MPLTRVSKTRRGFHYLFKWSDRLNAYATNTIGLLPGIDMRGDGSFIIVPSGDSERSWICEEQLAELPEMWYGLMAQSESKRQDKNWRSIAITDLGDGTNNNRHDTFVRLAASSLNAKWPIEDTLAMLLPTAKNVGFESEAKAIVLDVYHRYRTGGTMDERRKDVRRWTDHLGKTVSDLFPSGIPAEWKERCPVVVSEFERLLNNFETLGRAWENETSPWAGSLAQGAYLHVLTYLQELHAMPRSKKESSRQAVAFDQWADQEKKNVRIVSPKLIDDTGAVHPNVAKVISILGGRIRETV